MIPSRRKKARRGLSARSIAPIALALAASAVALASCANVLGIDGDYFEAPTTATGTGGTSTGTPTGSGGSSTGTTVGGGGGGSSCFGDAECADVEYCDASVQRCAPDQAAGQGCDRAAQCLSDRCVDDLCCDAPCDGPCQSCAAAATGGVDGQCASIPLGTDPDDECTGDEYCDGNGACTDLGTSCGNGGECQSTHCADGVCCDAACDGVCESCLAADTGGADGRCLPIPPGQDPDTECPVGEVCSLGTCIDCDLRPAPTGSVCPPACTGGCSAGVCTIACDSPQACDGATLTCPDDFECVISCSDHRACRDATVVCPSALACDVQCSCTGPRQDCCQRTVVQCSTGVCAMTCSDGTRSCENAALQCGIRECTATCTGTVQPAVDCGNSCSCTTC